MSRLRPRAPPTSERPLALPASWESGTSCPTAGSSFTSATAGSATTFTGLTNGATYECYAAEYLTADGLRGSVLGGCASHGCPAEPPDGDVGRPWRERRRD